MADRKDNITDEVDSRTAKTKEAGETAVQRKDHGTEAARAYGKRFPADALTISEGD
jgi:hypothetical protein